MVWNTRTLLGVWRSIWQVVTHAWPVATRARCHSRIYRSCSWKKGLPFSTLPLRPLRTKWSLARCQPQRGNNGRTNTHDATAEYIVPAAERFTIEYAAISSSKNEMKPRAMSATTNGGQTTLDLWSNVDIDCTCTRQAQSACCSGWEVSCAKTFVRFPKSANEGSLKQ